MGGARILGANTESSRNGAKGLLSASIAGGNAIIIIGQATSNRLKVAWGNAQPGVSATTAYVPRLQFVIITFTIIIGRSSSRRL
jgi:hypothetical protein